MKKETFTISVMENLKEDNKLVKDNNGKNVTVETTMDIDKLTFMPLTKSNDNTYSFMDSLLDKANKGIKTVVDKHNDKANYTDDKGMPKAKATVEQGIKREMEYINISTVIVKLLNKSTLNNDDITSIIDYVTYNDKSKTTVIIEDGMKYSDFVKAYPNVKASKIFEIMMEQGFTLDNKTKTFVKL